MNKNVRIILIASLAVLLTALIVILVLSFGGRGGEQAEATATITSTPAPTIEPTPEPIVWKSSSDVPFEIEIRNVVYKLEPFEENVCCAFTDEAGTTVQIFVQSLDYANAFDQLIRFFKGTKPEKLSVGKTSQTVIVIRADDAEMCFKINETRCFTLQAPTREAIEAFLDNAVIRADGQTYQPLDETEEYEEIELS